MRYNSLHIPWDFEFQDTDEQVFRALLAELRDQRANPEWAYITLELEIWMTKIG